MTIACTQCTVASAVGTIVASNAYRLQWREFRYYQQPLSLSTPLCSIASINSTSSASNGSATTAPCSLRIALASCINTCNRNE